MTNFYLKHINVYLRFLCFNVSHQSHQKSDAMIQNNIKQLRTQLSITQRELAYMVGTSQQQIQRIETGKVAAKLGLAQAICNALDKPLNIVFPESDQLINDFHKKRRKTDEDLEAIATSGIEMDSGLWTVKLWLQGQQDYLLLPISAADKRRFYYYFQETASPNVERFFVFDSDQYRYALNMREWYFTSSCLMVYRQSLLKKMMITKMIILMSISPW
jgi:DNA-binding XRE family transcriptional regulator